MLERLLTDEESKDVTIKMSNGTLRAHSLILGASSDAIKGMLSHGVAKCEKTLSWEDQTVEVGCFVLRLVYTGTIEEHVDWEKDAAGHLILPLKILLGGLQIAKVFQIVDLMKPLCLAIEQRITEATFNVICSASIAMDLTSLRRTCVSFAKEHLADGTRVQALININAQAADVPRDTVGIVEKDCVQWDQGFRNSIACVRTYIKVIEDSPSSIHAMYQKNRLSPEVMFELAPLFARPTEPPKKKLRRTL